MGGTKSKVDSTQEEESDTSSQISDSTCRNTEYTRHQDDQRRHKRRSSNRKKRQSDASTPSPDDDLDKPFKYRSRKDRLLDSLNGAGDHFDRSSDDNDSNEKGKNDKVSEKGKNGKVSVQKIVDNIQANLHAKSGSTSSIRDDAKKPSKILSLSNDSNSHVNRNKKSNRRKSSTKAVASSKEVKPTGVEEKIIESLIQPRKRQCSLPRSAKIKDSTQSMNVLSNPIAVSLDNEVSRNVPPKPPAPPPIDFSDGSESERQSQKPEKRMSTLTSSIQGKDLKPLDSILPRTEPTHLQELKLRFSNDVPRSPHEDNLNSISITEKSTSKQSEQPLNRQESTPSKCYFTNNVPVADSLHILTNEPRPPEFVIRGAKDQHKRSNEHRSKYRKTQEPESNHDLHQNDDNASNISKRKADQGNRSRSTSTCPKSILKSNEDDDIIKCFPVKTEYNKETKDLAKEKLVSTGRRGRDRDRTRNSDASYLKTARTQTSSLGLIDSGVQTLPDLGLQGQVNRKNADVDYKAEIDKKARKVLRRVSMDRSVDRKTSKDKRGRRYRNGSTQWEDVDLLDNSSCSMLNEKRSNASKERPRTRNRAGIEGNEQLSRCNDSRDCQDCYRGNEVCCMHVQVIPDSPADRRSTRHRSRPSKRSEPIEKEEPKDRTHREESKNREGCSCSGLSSEKLTAWATYSTSSGRSQELSLLSPFRSSSTVRSKSKPKVSHGEKNDDVYRQMEELGLGFLREGEWDAYGAIIMTDQSTVSSRLSGLARFHARILESEQAKHLKIDIRNQNMLNYIQQPPTFTCNKFLPNVPKNSSIESEIKSNVHF